MTFNVTMLEVLCSVCWLSIGLNLAKLVAALSVALDATPL